VKFSNNRAHYDYYSLVLGYWGTGNLKQAMENYQLAVERDPRFGEFKTLNERTAEWTLIERRAIHEVYVLWSKTVEALALPQGITGSARSLLTGVTVRRIRG
jgi:hypothetical protein